MIPRARAFDALADGYDDAFTRSLIGGLLRSAVWARLDAAVARGDRVLDLGCGTGEDALHLAERGVRVLAVDASEAMVREARARVGSCALGDLVDVRRVAAEDVAELAGEHAFDAVLSNFGVLNCVDDLGSVARDLARLVRPGGRAFLCIMGPAVPWEWIWFLLRRQPRNAFRRLRRGGVEWRGIRVRYPSIAAARRAFTPGFRTRNVAAIGALVPPTYAEAWALRNPALVRGLARWERRFESTPPLPWLADHYLLELERT